MRISDWSSDVCSSDLLGFGRQLCPGGINAGQYVVAQRLRDIVVARPRATRGSVETGAAARLLGIGKILQFSHPDICSSFGCDKQWVPTPRFRYTALSSFRSSRLLTAWAAPAVKIRAQKTVNRKNAR